MLVAEAAALGWHLAGWLATVTISTPVVATVSVPVKACPIKRARYVPVKVPGSARYSPGYKWSVKVPVTCPLKRAR